MEEGSLEAMSGMSDMHRMVQFAIKGQTQVHDRFESDSDDDDTERNWKIKASWDFDNQCGVFISMLEQTMSVQFLSLLQEQDEYDETVANSEPVDYWNLIEETIRQLDDGGVEKFKTENHLIKMKQFPSESLEAYTQRFNNTADELRLSRNTHNSQSGM